MELAPMSALGQKRTCAVQNGMSALPRIATAKADSRKRECPLPIGDFPHLGRFVYPIVYPGAFFDQRGKPGNFQEIIASQRQVRLIADPLSAKHPKADKCGAQA